MNPVMYLPKHEDGPGWFFADEVWATWYGPFSTEEEAKRQLKYYVADFLDRPEETDPVDPDLFWKQQHTEAQKGEVVQPLPTDEQRDSAWYEELTKPRRKIDLEVVHDLFKVDGLIDGGYLSFIYGSRKGNFGGWGTSKSQYSNYLILMDSGGVRQAEYPEYKIRRSERRDKYDYMAETYERVKLFRKMIQDDPVLNTAILEGYEADDTIAILFLKGIGTRKVIAQDKDFFMVPHLGKAMVDHTGIPQFQRGLKLPKYALPPSSPGTWVLTQAIFGDKSDSIPRLLPSRKGFRELYSLLIKRAPNVLSAYWNCLAEFGDQFLTNVRLVLLPHPTLASEDYSMTNLLFEDLADGRYWNPKNFDDSILDQLLESIQTREW